MHHEGNVVLAVEGVGEGAVLKHPDLVVVRATAVGEIKLLDFFLNVDRNLILHVLVTVDYGEKIYLTLTAAVTSLTWH